MSAAESVAIIAASMAATVAVMLALHRGERIDDWAIWTATSAAALVSAVLLTETALGLARLLMS